MNPNGKILVMCFSMLFSTLFIVAGVFAIDTTITPAGNSHTSISNVNCGGQVSAQFTITDNGAGGLLCWYYTNENTAKQKLTTSCIRHNQVGSYSAYLTMPTSGSKTVTVQLECFDFWALLNGDTCQDAYTYDQAVANKYSCANANGNGCGGNTVVPRYWDLSCNPVTFTVIPSQSTISLYSGQSQTITITVTNTMASGSLTCNNVGTIASGGSANYQLPIQAPSSGSGSTTQSVAITCTALWGASNVQTTSITVNYQSDPCIASVSSAQSAISGAQTAIVNAQSKIKEASTLGADITSASSSLNQANSQLSTAQTSLSNAQSLCNSGDKTNGPVQANSAQSSASQAKTYATDALNAAQQAVTTFTQKKTDASNKLSQALSALASAKSMANKADGIVQNATTLGLDTIPAQTNVKSARAKIDSAQSYYQDAQSAFQQNNFDLASQKAASAVTYANDAESLANDAYSSLSTQISIAGEAGKAILSASSEVSQTDETLTKMQYIERSVEKWGVDLSDAKDITSTGQSNIDNAKDLLAQAKNRMQAGKYTDASTAAIQARDAAAVPYDRLSRIVSSMSLTTQDALDKAYQDASAKVAQTESAVTDASNTYAASQSEVLAAQNDLATAKSQLSNASSAIDTVKASTDLSSFVSSSDLAFSALDDVAVKSSSATSHANNAKLGLVTTVAVPTAAAVAAVGGGFLYWRRRKKISKVVKEIEKGVEKAEEKVEKEVAKVEEKIEETIEGKPNKRKKRKGTS